MAVNIDKFETGDIKGGDASDSSSGSVGASGGGFWNNSFSPNFGSQGLNTNYLIIAGVVIAGIWYMSKRKK